MQKTCEFEKLTSKQEDIIKTAENIYCKNVGNDALNWPEDVARDAAEKAFTLAKIFYEASCEYIEED